MRAFLRQLALHLSLFAALAISAEALALAEITQPAVFVLHVGQPSVSLVGLWRFHPGDDARFAAAPYGDSTWALLRSDQPWTGQGYQHLTGFAWYRFRIALPAGSTRLSLLLPTISSGYQCFLDGALVHTEGALEHAAAPHYSMPAEINLPQEERVGEQIHVVALRVWLDPQRDGSGEGGPNGFSVRYTRMGSTDEMKRDLADLSALQRQTGTVWLSLSLVFLTAGVLCALLFLMQRSNMEYFWYSIAACSYGLDLWLYYDSLTHSCRISTYLLLDSLFSAGTSVPLVLFFCYLLRFNRNWLVWVVIALSTLGSFTALLQGAGLMGSRSGATWAAVGGCAFTACGIWMVAWRAWQREWEAMVLLAPVMYDFGVTFVDSLRLRFPTAGKPVVRLEQLQILAYPFPVSVGDVSAGFVLFALVLVLVIRFLQTRREHVRILADMSAARSIQHLLIPDVLPEVPGYQMQAAYYPAQEVGGDFFQVIPAGPGRTLIVLGDVSGKGLPAAMTVSLAVGVLHTLVELTTSPGAVLTGLNSRLLGRGAGFTTCLAMEIADDGSLVFANAGQLAPYLNGFEIESEAGLPLGLFAGTIYPESTLQLSPGDRLTLLTDGVPEASSKRELLGFSRTEEMSQQTAERIAQTAREFGQTDDITVLSITFLADKD